MGWMEKTKSQALTKAHKIEIEWCTTKYWKEKYVLWDIWEVEEFLSSNPRYVIVILHIEVAKSILHKITLDALEVQ